MKEGRSKPVAPTKKLLRPKATGAFSMGMFSVIRIGLRNTCNQRLTVRMTTCSDFHSQGGELQLGTLYTDPQDSIRFVDISNPKRGCRGQFVVSTYQSSGEETVEESDNREPKIR